MTREEALVQLRLGPGINEDVSEEYNEAVDMAIKAIKTIPSENEQIIRIKKGTLKARTGKYVIYDVEWLKTHFNTTEAKIYGQPSEDCISRKDIGLTNLEILMCNGDYKEALKMLLDKIEKAPSVNPQQKTGRWISHSGHCEMNNLIPSRLGCYFWCSECNCGINYKYFHLANYKYCPNCGAKMQEVQQ